MKLILILNWPMQTLGNALSNEQCMSFWLQLEQVILSRAVVYV